MYNDLPSNNYEYNSINVREEPIYDDRREGCLNLFYSCKHHDFCKKYILSGCMFLWVSAISLFLMFSFLLGYYIYYAYLHNDNVIIPLIVGIVTLLSLMVGCIGICFQKNLCCSSQSRYTIY